MVKETKDTVRLGPLELRFLVDESNLVMFEFTIPPRAQVPVRHYHESVDEVVYGLSGTTTTSLDGKKHELRAGQSLLIPHGSVDIDLVAAQHLGLVQRRVRAAK